MAPFRAFSKHADYGPQTDVSPAELLASDLFKNGAFAPPPGVTQNLTHPDDIGSILILVTAIGLVVVFICVFIRVWIKSMIIGSPVRMAWSDLTFTLAILTIIVVFVAGLVSTTGYGGILGIHQWDVSLSRFFTRQSLVSLSVICTFNHLALGLIKVTIFLTYIETFANVNRIRILCTLGSLINGAFYLAVFIVSSVLSFPHRNETFASHILTGAPFHIEKISYPVAAVGLSIDLCLFVVPLVAVCRMKGWNRRKKIGTALIFAIGFLAILASAISFIYRRILKESGDQMWNLVPLYSVISIESYIGIIISCAPHISKFFRRYEQVFLKAGSKIKMCLSFKYMSRKELKPKKHTASSKASEAIEVEQSRKTIKMNPDLGAPIFDGSLAKAIGGARVSEEIQSKRIEAMHHPAAQYRADTHWAERQRDIQEKFCDGLQGDSGSL